MNKPNLGKNILIVEDDVEQMDLLVSFAREEIKTILANEQTSDDQREKIKQIQIIKVNNSASLRKAVTLGKGILLAIIDCNIPDSRGSQAHDQLVKTNHAITGQHKSVDIVTKHLPDAPITMISSLDRFQKIVSQFYERNHNLSINFIRKSDQTMIKRNINYYLRQYLKPSNK